MFDQTSRVVLNVIQKHRYIFFEILVLRSSEQERANVSLSQLDVSFSRKTETCSPRFRGKLQLV